MKKTRLLAWLLCTLLTAGGAEAKKVKVNVRQPGTLSQLVRPKDKYKITALVLRGTLNECDLRFLRELCGGADGGRSGGQVRSVDMRDVTFARGGKPFSVGNETCRVRGPHTVPDGLFRQCPIEEVVLPARTDTVGQQALAGTRLRRLVLPEEAVIADDILTGDSLLTELTLPALRDSRLDVGRLLQGLTGLRKLTFRDVDYVSGGTFFGMPALEELTFSGMVGHIDGFCVTANPHLRTIRFGGTVMSTGGTQFVKDCPELESVTFDGMVLCTYYGEAVGCPKFQGYRINGCVVRSEVKGQIPVTAPSGYGSAGSWANAFADIESWMHRYVEEAGFMQGVAGNCLPLVADVARRVGDSAALARFEALQARLDSALNAGTGEQTTSYLETLRLSAPYVRTGQTEPAFRYMPPTDSLLRRTRDYFNLDSIAGGGDDLSRIKNLLYWLHDHVRHDGSSSWPQCRFNAVDLYETCLREERGLNCRFLAIMLSEMLLAEGIPARYLTCQSKEWSTDSDCHVINVAWSASLGKWIWIDPSFAAYVADENGLLLHPGEVRERLRKGLPLVLNEDANWNHESRQTVENYLENYMAKNLYVISANLFQQSEPEGRSTHPQGGFVALVPDGFLFTQAGTVTSDDEYFWQAPPAIAPTEK